MKNLLEKLNRYIQFQEICLGLALQSLGTLF